MALFDKIKLYLSTLCLKFGGSKMKKISFMQFISVLIVSRLFVTMAYSPVNSENSLVTILGGLISTALQAAVIAAPVALVKKFPGRNVVELSWSVSRPVGALVSLIYASFLVWVSVRTLCDFSAFITYAFPIFTAKRMIIIFMAITALYISLLGLEPIVRTAMIVLALFIIMLITVLLGTSGTVDIHNLDLAVEEPLKQCIMSGINSAGRNTCIVAGCLLLPCLRSRHGGAIYSYLMIKYLVIALIIFLYTAILGNFSYSAQLPFFHLSSYSDSSVIARFDSLFLTVWTLCAVMKLSAYFWLAGECLKCFSPKIKRLYANSAVSAVALVTVMFMLRTIDLEPKGYPMMSTVALLLLTGGIPALMLLKRRES